MSIDKQQSAVTQTILEMQEAAAKDHMGRIRAEVALCNILKLIDSGKGAVRPFATLNEIERIAREIVPEDMIRFVKEYEDGE